MCVCVCGLGAWGMIAHRGAGDGGHGHRAARCVAVWWCRHTGCVWDGPGMATLEGVVCGIGIHMRVDCARGCSTWARYEDRCVSVCM